MKLFVLVCIQKKRLTVSASRLEHAGQLYMLVVYAFNHFDYFGRRRF
jgi:hypothetical protein